MLDLSWATLVSFVMAMNLMELISPGDSDCKVVWLSSECDGKHSVLRLWCLGTSC